MAKTYGIDISHWEGRIDWLIASQHLDFAIFKATDGYFDFVDSEFANNKRGCIANHVPWGAYHYYQPAFDPIDQAEHFVKTVGAGCHVYVVDVEEDYGTGDDWEDLLKEFLDRVEELTGKKPMIYTSPGFWNTFMIPVPSWTSQYDLWVAHWGVTVPTLPKGWSTYVIHQIGATGSIPGIPGACDEDWFNGDINAVWTYFGMEAEPPPVPPPLPLGKVKVNVSNLNVRKRVMEVYPDYTGIIGLTTYGKEWDVLEVVKDNKGNEWVKVQAYIAKWLCKDV